MSMMATHKVIDSTNTTTGFMIDNTYFHYYNVLQNIALIDNLALDENGAIYSLNGELTICPKKDIHLQIYTQLCDANPLQRDIQLKLENWRQNWNQYVLYLTGARQTGKTTELLKFAYKNYEQIVYVNLADEISANLFETLVLSNSLSFGMINYCQKARLEEFHNSPDTILIIDEIQENYKIYNHIRTLQSGLKCHVAVTGSYLGKTLHSKYFKPAGNMYEVEMLPLSFREFCRAYHLEDLLLSIDLYGGSKRQDYALLTEKYKIYMEIGGYPAVVNTYLLTNTIENCRQVTQTIIERFTEESASYFQDDKCAIVFDNVYKAAFISMTKEKKGTSSKDVSDMTDFIISDTKEHVSRKEINRALAWLKYSKIIGSCDLYNQGRVSDLLNERRFYFMDCGIASYIASLTPVPNDAVNGAIAENFVYSELYRLYKDHRLKGDKPCCSVYNNYELDFMLVDKNDVRYGIEVKSASASSHNSLDVYLQKNLIDAAYLAEISRGGIGEYIRTIPIYTVGCRFPYTQEDLK